MSIDHASGVAATKTDPVFLHVRAGMTVIVDDGSDWRMADVIWVDGCLLYTSPSPRDKRQSRMPSSA